MPIHHMIFQPTLSGAKDSSDEMPLDMWTPRGLFRGTGVNRYLVCDNPTRRFAVALRHEEFAPFTRFALGELAADTGEFHGVGKFHLSKPDVTNSGAVCLGGLNSDPEGMRLFVRNMSGATSWSIVAYGVGAAFARYDEWTLMVDDDDPFFSSDGVY